MTDAVIETVRNLLSQFTFQLVSDDIVEDLSCISCRRLTINPYQTYCGCIYCDECVVVHFGSSDNYCSGGREDCREEYIILEKNILKNAVLNRNILRLKVRCPNRYCNSVTELTHMGEHLRVCTKQLMKCPYSNIGCYDDRVTKDGMLTHLHENSITHSEMLVDLIQNLRNEIKENFNQTKLDIPVLKEESRMEDAEKEQLMNEIAERMNTLSNELSDHRREIEMINKTNHEKIRLLEERMQEQENKLQSHNKDILMKIEREKKDSNIKMTVSALTTRQLEERMQKQETEVQSQKKDILIKIEEEKKERNNKMTEKKLKIRQLEERMQKQETEVQSQKKDMLIKVEEEKKERNNKMSCANVVRSVSALQTKVDELVRVVDGITTWKNTTVAVGRSTFKVNGFSAMKASAEAIYSPYFYSHSNGYKLRLEVYPGGFSGGRGTHVSAYIVVCKGEYDDLLEWPCEHSVTISVVNHSSGENHISQIVGYSTAPDECKHSYHKPIKGDNTGYGWPTFISHTSLESSPGLVVGDALLLLCVVTPPP